MDSNKISSSFSSSKYLLRVFIIYLQSSSSYQWTCDFLCVIFLAATRSLFVLPYSNYPMSQTFFSFTFRLTISFSFTISLFFSFTICFRIFRVGYFRSPVILFQGHFPVITFCARFFLSITICSISLFSLSQFLSLSHLDSHNFYLFHNFSFFLFHNLLPDFSCWISPVTRHPFSGSRPRYYFLCSLPLEAAVTSPGCVMLRSPS